MEQNGKEQFKLHCALLCAQDGAKKSDAPWKAWLEGPKGLQQRLGTPKMDFEQTEAKK